MRSKLYGCAWRRAQRPDFAAQPRRLERLLDQQRDLVEIERLVRVVIRALLHRLDGQVRRSTCAVSRMTSVSGSRSLMRLSTDEAVAVRQPVVEQHQIDAVLALRERAGGRVGLDDAVAFVGQPLVQREANQRLVVDDENGRRLHRA